MRLNEKLVQLKTENGLTTDALSLKSGVPKGTINKILNGETRNPTVATLAALARALECPLEYLGARGDLPAPPDGIPGVYRLGDALEGLRNAGDILPAARRRVPLLGRIAVCEDLDCAIRIAQRHRYQFKIVTLDGQVINAGGSMTGGSRATNSGFLSRRTEIEKLNEECRKMSEGIALREKDLKAAVERYSNERASYDAAKAEQIEQNETRVRLEGVLATTAAKLAEAERSLRDTLAEKENGVLFVPGKAANAGGVATSGLEMSQNSERLSWTFDEVDAKLKGIMTGIYANIAGAAKEYGLDGNYVAGANIAGFAKVVNAMLAQGAY